MWIFSVGVHLRLLEEKGDQVFEEKKCFSLLNQYVFILICTNRVVLEFRNSAGQPKWYGRKQKYLIIDNNFGGVAVSPGAPIAIDSPTNVAIYASVQIELYVDYLLVKAYKLIDNARARRVNTSIVLFGLQMVKLTPHKSHISYIYLLLKCRKKPNKSLRIACNRHKYQSNHPTLHSVLHFKCQKYW